MKKGKKSFKRTEENIEELKIYQQKLILNITGFPDDYTINAHNKYIAKKRKRSKEKEKKRLKRERKKQRKLKKRITE